MFIMSLDTDFGKKLYVNAMMIKLKFLGLNCEKQKPIFLTFKDTILANNLPI